MSPHPRAQFRLGVLLLTLLLTFVANTKKAQAQGLTFAGHSTLAHNDMLGDGHDRWRTGGYVKALFFRGKHRSYEFRGRLELITPYRLDDGARADRPSTDLIGFGVFAHERYRDINLKYGVEAVLTNTGLLGLQEAFHRIGGFDGGFMTSENSDAEGARRFYVAASAEVSKEFRLGRVGAFRPFVEAEIGFENFLRLGGDIALNASGFSPLVSRDPVTGFLVPTKSDIRKSHSSRAKVSAYLGADISILDGSALFSGSQTQSKHLRNRLRAGVIVGGKMHQFFYGITRLSKEFEGQPEAQYLGSLSYSIRF